MIFPVVFALPQASNQIAVATAGISQKGGLNTPMGALVAGCMASENTAALAFINSGAIRGNFSAGPITADRVHTILPFNDTIVTFDYTGQQLLNELEFIAADKVNATTGQTYRLFFPLFSGIGFTFSNGTLPSGQRVSSVTVNGEPLDLATTYKVATLDYLVGKTLLPPQTLDPTTVSSSKTFVADAVISCLTKQGTVSPDNGKYIVQAN
ncbi:5'-nucleotidase [Gorgonomyces haynaldii]|nr:5'-nucleotidase [Gorgonomyces haynaldii]